MHNNEVLKNQLSHKAVVYWRIEEFITLFVTVLIFGGLLGCSLYWDWSKWVMYIFIILLVLCSVGSVVGLCTLQKRFKHWSYTYNDRFFYIHEGVWKKRIVIVPFEKIQTVTLIEGSLLSQLNLAAIELQVIEKVYCVPALDKHVALSIQQKLAELTRQKEASTDETITTAPRI